MFTAGGVKVHFEFVLRFQCGGAGIGNVTLEFGNLGTEADQLGLFAPLYLRSFGLFACFGLEQGTELIQLFLKLRLRHQVTFPGLFRLVDLEGKGFKVCLELRDVFLQATAFAFGAIEFVAHTIDLGFLLLDDL